MLFCLILKDKSSKSARDAICLSTVYARPEYHIMLYIRHPGFYMRSLGWLQSTKVKNKSELGPTEICNFRNTTNNALKACLGLEEPVIVFMYGEYDIFPYLKVFPEGRPTGLLGVLDGT